MNACTLKAPAPIDTRPLVYGEVLTPTPAADEVLIEVSACGMCRTDLHVVEGDLPVRRADIIPGHQIVGRVQAVGAAAGALHVGERVGVAWLHRTCGVCRFCRAGRENLCER